MVKMQLEETHSEYCRISYTERFAKIVIGQEPSIIFIKSCILHASQGSEYASELDDVNKCVSKFTCITDKTNQKILMQCFSP